MTALTVIVRILIGVILFFIGLAVLPTPIPIGWAFFTLSLIVLSNIFPPANWILKRLFKSFPKLKTKLESSRMFLFIKKGG